MAEVILPAGGYVRPGPKRFELASEDGLVRLRFPYEPGQLDNAGLATEYARIPRPGRMPLVTPAGEGLHVVSFAALLARPDYDASVEDELRTIRALARGGLRVVMVWGPSERGLWRITSFDYTVLRKRRPDMAITRAIVQLELTRAVDSVVKVGPLTGGPETSGGGFTRPDDEPPEPEALDDGRPRPGSTYTVKAGDTLWAIATAAYGSGQRWQVIADANGITDPRTLAAGQRLDIPRVDGLAAAGIGAAVEPVTIDLGVLELGA